MSRFSPKLKRKVTSVLPFGIIWLICGLFFLFVEYAIISVMEPQSAPMAAISLTPKIVLFASVSVFFVGCLVGFIEITYINKFFLRWSFIQKIIGKLIFYGVLFFIIIYVFYMLAASIDMNKSLFSKAVFERYILFLFSITSISTSVQISFSLLLSLIYSEIEDNLGQAVFLNFFTGKYHKPVEEQRIFMFTDMKDSTSIAETLGHVRYFDFLRHYYNDLSSAIINSYGVVYQYIGDEIVISWDLNRANAAEYAVQCFFEMKRDLEKRRDWYLDNFSIYPGFKGALHLGNVTTGEIGALKKEIFFTGDVLNTAARMQAMCTNYGTDLLVSEQLIEALKNKEHYDIKHVGQTKPKGKRKLVELYTIHMDLPYL